MEKSKDEIKSMKSSRKRYRGRERKKGGEREMRRGGRRGR